MATDNKNDIVISAAADTKNAEANLKKLEAQVQTMGKNDPGMAKLNQSFAKTGKATDDINKHVKDLAGSYGALQGSMVGIVSQLGAIGIAIGVVKVAWDSLQQIQKKNIDSMNARADAQERYYNTVQTQSKEILSNLNQLNELAANGYLDNQAIQATNNLVAQLNDLWGDVGLSVDQATGRVNGLSEATKKVANNLREIALTAAKERQAAARMKQAQANREYSKYFDGNGAMTLAGALRTVSENGYIASVVEGMTPGGQQALTDRKATELHAAIATADAEVKEADAEVKRLESKTTTDDINALANRNSTRQQQEAGLKDVDTQLMELQRQLATAQAMGGNVEAAKAALDGYTENQARAKFEQLQKQIAYDTERQAYYQQRYNTGLKHGNAEEIAKRLDDLTKANEQLKKHTEEMTKIANGLYKPAVVAPEVKEMMRITSVSNGTFDAFGTGALGQNNIQQQQLDVQKKIEKNTEKLAVPVVGE